MPHDITGALLVVNFLYWTGQVQSDHFDTFLKPEMAKCGYSAVYKKKTKEVSFYESYLMFSSNEDCNFPLIPEKNFY